MGSPRKAFPGEQNFTLESVNRAIESLIGVINNNSQCLIDLIAGDTVIASPGGGGGGGGGVIPPVILPGPTKADLCEVEYRAWLWRDRP